VKRGKQAKIKLAPNFICPVSRSRVWRRMGAWEEMTSQAPINLYGQRLRKRRKTLTEQTWMLVSQTVRQLWMKFKSQSLDFQGIKKSPSCPSLSSLPLGATHHHPWETKKTQQQE
jgi:hypothetical protein